MSEMLARLARLLAPLTVLGSLTCQHGILVEAESFADRGGWQLDTQFVHAMGSPYLLAHGLGAPVADARTTVELPAAGTWRVLVRTYDWVARWDAPGAPGRFRVLVDGAEIGGQLGVEGRDWGWHEAGEFGLDEPGAVQVALRDLTGFCGRADALWFTTDRRATPPADGEALAAWRVAQLGEAANPTLRDGYDLVVVGGGYGGTAAAISAARMGCRVALIQDRPVLGGNGSSEVRVWAKGGIRRGAYPRLGEIVEEFQDQATNSPGTEEEFVDDLKEQVVRAEPNLDLFLNTRCDVVTVEDDRIVAVEAFDTRNGARSRFEGTLFCDATGHGHLGAWAGADLTIREREHLGSSNMWRWEQGSESAGFPAVPWALDLGMADFPYPRNGKGEWFWESGFDQHPIDDLEAIRDWNLRAVFGAFATLKHGPKADEHRNARLQWVAFVAGTRESRQLLGDVVLTRDDIVAKKAFPDGCVPTTWDIDLHYPKEEFAKRYPDNPFISRAHFDRSVDKEQGYPVPYRCFYSRNIRNLFMAGRCVSVTHEALGTVRVMKTGGMIGEVVGKAASICAAEGCQPRDVYTEHLEELKRLMRLPGKARRATVDGELVIPEDVPPTRSVAPETLQGLVVDDHRAKLVGEWQSSTHEAGYVGERYLHDDAAGKGERSAVFTLRPRQPGRYAVELTWRASPSRSTAVPVRVRARDFDRSFTVNQREQPGSGEGFGRLCELDLQPGAAVEVTVSNAGTEGHVIVDAARLLRIGDGGDE